MHLRAGLGGTGGVGDHEVGDALERHGAHGRRERRAAVAHREERGEVVGLLVQLQQEGPQDGVAHDGHGVALLALDHRPDVVGDDTARLVGEEQRRPLRHQHEGGPLCRAVHERRQDHELERHALGQAFGQPLVAGDDLPRAHLPPAHGGHEDVVLAPQHALGHAGRPARVEDVEVVGRGVHRCALRRGCGQRLLVPRRPGEEGVARVVLDLEQHLGRCVQRGQHLRQRRGEGRVQDHRPRPRVVEQVAQLLADVAVVDVERGHPGPVAAQHPLEVLVAVVEGEGHVVLPRLPALEARPFALHAEPTPVEVGAEPSRAIGDLAVGQAAVAPDDALALGEALDEHVEGLGQVELDGGLLWGAGRARPRTVPASPRAGGVRSGRTDRHRQRSRRGRPQPGHRRGHRRGRRA